jgi:hypothetical protein
VISNFAMNASSTGELRYSRAATLHGSLSTIESEPEIHRLFGATG